MEKKVKGKKIQSKKEETVKKSKTSIVSKNTTKVKRMIPKIKRGRIRYDLLEKRYLIDAFSMDADDAISDKVIENDDNMSIGLIFLILLICFVVGILTGYFLYRLAIDNSAIMWIRYF